MEAMSKTYEDKLAQDLLGYSLKRSNSLDRLEKYLIKYLNILNIPILQSYHPPQESGDIVIVSLLELLVLLYSAVNKLDGQDVSSVPCYSARVLLTEKCSGSIISHKIAINGKLFLFIQNSTYVYRKQSV